MQSSAVTTNTAPSPFGHFALLAKLARGDLADLYLARRRAAGGFEKLVVIKRIHLQLTSDPELIEMFLGEARVAASIEHPNVRRVYELGKVEPHFYIALEYLEGVPLVELLLARRRDLRLADQRLATSLLAQVCEGLHSAHGHSDRLGRPVVHGDLNPRSLFITSNGYAKILDFDIVEMRGALAARHGFVRRTCAYMSPEQVRGEEITAHSDIFSLGVVAWETVTGRRLFKQQSKELTLAAIDHGVIPRASDVRPDISPELDEAIARALARNPARRHPSARDFGRALEKAALEEGPPLTTVGVAALLEETFAPQLGAQRAFVRRARTESETPLPEEMETIEREDPGDVDDWDANTGARTRIAGAEFPRRLLPLQDDPTSPRASVAPDDEAFDGELFEADDDGIPDPLGWQESSSLILAVPSTSELDVEAGSDDTGVVIVPASPSARASSEGDAFGAASEPRSPARSGLPIWFLPTVLVGVGAAVVAFLIFGGNRDESDRGDEVAEIEPAEIAAASDGRAAGAAKANLADANANANADADADDDADDDAKGERGGEPDRAQPPQEAREPDRAKRRQEAREQERRVERQRQQARDEQREREQRQAREQNKAREAKRAREQQAREQQAREARRAREQQAREQRQARAREQQAREAQRDPGFLTLDSQPYATVFIDGEKRGYTPIVKQSLSAGVHRIKLVAGDGSIKTLRIEIEPDQTVRRRVTW